MWQVEGVSQSTPVQRATTKPAWNEPLVFRGVSTHSSISIAVFSKDLFDGKRFLGQVRPDSLKVFPGAGDMGYCGFSWVRFCWYDSRAFLLSFQFPVPFSPDSWDEMR